MLVQVTVVFVRQKCVLRGRHVRFPGRYGTFFLHGEYSVFLPCPVSGYGRGSRFSGRRVFSGSIVSANQEVVEISIEKGESSNEVIFHSPPCLKEDGLTMFWFSQMMALKGFCFPGIFPYSVFLVSHSWQAVRQ